MSGLLKSAASGLFSLLGQPAFWLMLGLLVLAKWLNSRRGKGAQGEAIVKLALRLHLDSKLYHPLHGILIRKADGETTELDHIIVSRFGIFVIETKNWKGRGINGTADSEQWRVYYGKGRSKDYQNPLRQNANHIKALADLLHLPLSTFHNIVFMAGEAKLNSGPIPGVLYTGLGAHVKSYQQPVLTEGTVLQHLSAIRQASLSKLPGAMSAHIEQVRARANPGKRASRRPRQPPAPKPPSPDSWEKHP